MSLEDSENAKGSRAVFLVREISCSTCGLAIEKQVKKLDGVRDVKTSVMLNRVFVDYDSSKVELDEIKRAVDKTGYGSYLTLKKQ
jgi:P-type Cu+ transporter